MKIVNFIGAVVLCALISLSHGSVYEYQYDNKQTCIEIKTDVMFTLTNGIETIKFDGSNFTAKSGDCAWTNETVASIKLGTVKDDFLDLTFMYNAQNQTTMGAMFTFAPFEYFPEASSPITIPLADNGDLTMGGNKQLYKCNSPQTMKLSGSLENVTYTLYMDMSNTQIQAFGIENGNLSSDVFVCSADQSTTAAAQNGTTESSPTTEVTTKKANESTTAPSTVTSEAPTNPTTAPPANLTTEGPTTALPTTAPTPAPTSAPPHPMPAASTYEVMGDGKACLIMMSALQLWVKADNKTTIIDVPASSDVNVSGSCASGNETESSMTITPKSGDLKEVTFKFMLNGDKSELVSVEGNLMVDTKSTPFTLNKTLQLSYMKLFYKCDVGGQLAVDDVTLKYEKLKVQAFNVEDGKFSENGEDCEKDVDPIANASDPPVNMFSVRQNNNTCVVFKGKVQFQIPYQTKNGNATDLVGLPTKFSVTGKCNTTLNGYLSQEMTIKFYDDWSLTMYFTSDVKQASGDLLAAGTVTKYHISQIKLDYEYNNNLFTDPVSSIVGTTDSAMSTNLTALTTDKGKSYLCNKGDTFTLDNGLQISVKSLQFQAFKDKDSTDFGDSSECSADEETNSIVPIAVGAALAGLVIIVLIAYLIGRKRSRAGYEQV